MGGASLPTASTPGYTTFRGFVACKCLAEWLPVYEQLLLAKGLIKSNIDVWQLTGGAPASGGTHTQGGAYDLLNQTGPEEVLLAREMGAGSWGRTVDQGFTQDHHHGVLNGCEHNEPAVYQYTAMRRGFNGLGIATSGQYAGMWGYAHPDEYPLPATFRTWEQGIAWAKTEIARLSPKPIVQEDDMTPEQAKQLNDIYAAVTGLRSEESGRYVTATNRHGWVAKMLTGIAEKVGISIDETALASEVAAALSPTVRDAVLAAGQTEAVADAVVAKLGAALNPSA